LETSDKTVMANRINDLTYGGSQASYRVDCDNVICPSSGCFSTP
jgi:hypothetical protein